MASALCTEEISGGWKVDNIDNSVVLAPAAKRVESGTISSWTLTEHCMLVQDLGNDSCSKYMMYTCRDVFIHYKRKDMKWFNATALY